MPAERQLLSRINNGTVVNTKNVPRLRRGRADRVVRPYKAKSPASFGRK